MAKYKSAMLPSIHPQARRVQRIAANLINKSELAKDIDWQVHVVQSETANAFVLPSGQIFVFTGLLQKVKNDDQLAAVIAHEISHVLCRHVSERMSRMSLAWKMRNLVAFVFGGDTANLLFNPVVFTLAFQLPNSRQQEQEADFVGLMLMSAACYDPREAAEFWRQSTLSGGLDGKNRAPPELLSTHPSDDTRHRKLTSNMPEAKRIYNMNGCEV